MPLPNWPDDSPGGAGADGGPADPTAASSTVSLFIATMTISRPTKSEDNEGGRTFSWSSVGTGVCRVDNVEKPHVIEVAGKITTITAVKIQFPVVYLTSTPLYPKDRIVTGGATYELLDSDKNLSNATAWTWWAVRIGPQ